MPCYDASENPDPKAWLALEESKRVDLVIDFHCHNHLTLGRSDKLHGAVHMIVENQFALAVEALPHQTIEQVASGSERRI